MAALYAPPFDGKYPPPPHRNDDPLMLDTGYGNDSGLFYTGSHINLSEQLLAGCFSQFLLRVSRPQ